MAREQKVDPRVTKRRVTMRSAVFAADGSLHTHEAVDYVRPDHLDAYVTASRADWQAVLVSDEPDAGPDGYDGATFVPTGLPLPDAGTFYAATGHTEAAAREALAGAGLAAARIVTTEEG